ncbi:ETX/MTX2 family pore-forming toxin [Dickeya sp. NCPPB 3274]|uniref:ETX/MTX2 family pore-forming toxin n=1 Tax=Dickeya sp. NCPPB 3274 TaxID=568766 RepID=UPI0005B4C1EC|nr:ETX/MTX2 family pore-forming toxin [Dickeya sp. NCPPB 3274]
MSIKVDITASSDNHQTIATATGNDIAVISNEERGTFQLNDQQLKRAVEVYFGRKPNDAYLSSPTPWGDLYKTYNWQQVMRTLQPVSTRVISQNSTPVIVMEQDFVNNSSVPAVYNVKISQSVQNTVKSSWNTGGKLTVGQKVKYGISFLGTGGGGESSISYEQSWGIGGEQSTTITLGTESGLQVTLQPGQAVTAELVASRGSMKVQVDYQASLSGISAVNYNPTYKDHHFWGLPITQIMRSSNISNSIVSSEIIDIGFYADSKVILRDKNTGGVFRTFNLFDKHTD